MLKQNDQNSFLQSFGRREVSSTLYYALPEALGCIGRTEKHQNRFRKFSDLQILGNGGGQRADKNLPLQVKVGGGWYAM